MSITATVGDDPAAFDRALAPWQRFSLAMLVVRVVVNLIIINCDTWHSPNTTSAWQPHGAAAGMGVHL